SLGHHCDGCKEHGPIHTTFQAERLPRIALAERDLAAFPNDLDFNTGIESRGFHAIMLSCARAGATHHLAATRLTRPTRHTRATRPTCPLPARARSSSPSCITRRRNCL